MSDAKEHPYRLGRKQFSLGRNRNYQYVYRKGKNYPSRYMALVYMRARDLKVGYSVSSKVGNAVTRNRLRRILREDFRLLRPFLKNGRYILVARTCMKDAPRSAIPIQMRSLFERASLFRTEEP